MFYQFPPKMRELLLNLEQQKQLLLTGWLQGAGLPEGNYEVAPDFSGVRLKAAKENSYANGTPANPAAQNPA